MTNTFRIYNGDEVIAEGASPLAIVGLEPNTSIEDGVYQVVRLEDDNESERVDIPSFSTLPVGVEGVALSPKTSRAEAGSEGSRQLNVEVQPENASNKEVTFSITGAEGLNVSDTGLITWSESVPAGEYETTVTTTDGELTDKHTLTLTEPE